MFVIAMQGLPGSGKTTLAKIIAAQPYVVVCSADDYFVNKATGAYKWEPTQLREAHAYCFTRFVKAMESGFSVVIDNTNLLPKDYEDYSRYAKNNGYQFHVLRMCTTLNDAELSIRNVHGVPQETIKRMRERLIGTNTNSSR